MDTCKFLNKTFQCSRGQCCDDCQVFCCNIHNISLNKRCVGEV
ncbi:hypothetical protein MXB_2377 [Myxobolus squamalis]|nr:hypothetical protein MXB_2377 [Myxobolus squamalis]